MKFVHIADVHFDMPFTSMKYSKKIINQRRIDMRNAFYQSVNFVKENQAEMLFISGDLFEQRFVENETIHFILACLKRIPEVKVFIAPGNHDPLFPSSPYYTFDWPENVTIFTNEMQRYEYGDVVVYGQGFADYEMHHNQIHEIEIDETKVNILVTHGTLDGNSYKYNDIKHKELAKFDYVALGHIHMPKVDESRMIYPGSLISCGMDELGPHGLVYGDIDKTDCQIQFKKMDARELREIELHLTEEDEEKTVNEIVETIDFQEDVCRVTLTGRRISQLEQLIDTIKDLDKYICGVNDKTEFPYDLENIAKEKTLKGIFTAKMIARLKEQPEKEEEIHRAIEIAYKNM